MELNKDSNDYSGEDQEQEKRSGGNRKKEDDGGYYLVRPLKRNRLRSSPYFCMKCDEPFRQVYKISDEI